MNTHNDPNLIVVYGTLMRRHRAYPLLKNDSEFVGEATLPGTLFSLGGFPGVRLNGSGEFDCEVHRIKPESRTVLLQNLDRYEGEGSLYHRRVVDTEFGPAYIYEYNGDAGEPMRRWG
jgi:gamma-glutamylcyclotransferase (GGCT)/AIG2-like uncharacterized protein YtfP